MVAARMPGMEVFVVSRTLRQKDHPGVTIVDEPKEPIAELRSQAREGHLASFGGGLHPSAASPNCI